MDRQELSGGVWDSAYEYFGAHPCDGGWVFRVWAPQARCVALCGDFNEWQRWDMRRLADGAWELTVENARQFDAYQYVVTQCDGREVWKSDPYGFHQETRPSTNSKLYDGVDVGAFYEKLIQLRQDMMAEMDGGAQTDDDQTGGGRAPTPPRAL